MPDGEPRNEITPRQLAVALIHHEIADVRTRIAEHVAHRRADDLYNSEIRVFLERAAELLRNAAGYLQDTAADDDVPE
jgi:hypothetical protein